MTPKQERFVQEYLKDLNATQAAIRAGYSESTAGKIGHENLTKPEIQAAVAKAQMQRAARTEVTQDRVIHELAKIAFSDLRHVADWSGGRINTKDSGQIPDKVAGAISEVRNTKEGIAVKMHDKIAALDRLGKHLGMFVEKVDHTSSDGSMTPAAPDTVTPAAVAALVDKLTG